MRRLRFSLFDLFVITLGVAAALAYHRVSGVRWTDAFLALCSVWIVVGMAQQARSAYLIWRGISIGDKELRNGAVLALARPLAAIAMFAAAIGFEVARKIDPIPHEYWLFDGFTPSLFSLAIVCAYTSPGRRQRPKSVRWQAALQTGLDVVALLLGAALLLYIVASAEAVSALVHVAIRGVENYQPTRWGGKPFFPFSPRIDLSREFFRLAVGTALSASLSATSTVLMAAYWNRRLLRWLLAATSVTGIGLAAYWEHWCWTVGYPTFSPYLAQYTGTQPWYVVAAGLSVAAATCFLFVMRYGPEPHRLDAPRIANAYHSPPALMALLLAAMIADGFPDWWEFSSANMAVGLPSPFRDLQTWWDSGARLSGLPMALLQIVCGLLTYWLDDARMLLRLAAILVVGNRFWRWRRGDLAEAVVPLRAGKLITVSMFSAAALLVAVPAGAWLGFAMMTTTVAGF